MFVSDVRLHESEPADRIDHEGLRKHRLQTRRSLGQSRYDEPLDVIVITLLQDEVNIARRKVPLDIQTVDNSGVRAAKAG